MKNKIPLFVIALALIATLGAAQAATVTWSANGTISGDSDVLVPMGPSQTVIAALGFSYGTGNNTTSIVNGVTFTNVNSYGYTTNGYNDITGATNGVPSGATITSANLSGAVDSYNTAPSAYLALSAGYQEILHAAIYGTYTPVPSLTLNNLVVGDQYRVRFWTYDGYDYPQSLTITSDGVSSPAAPEGDGQGDLGSYLTATFTADSSSQTFTFANSDSYNPAINALEVIQLVPEPSTVALLSAAAGLVGLVAVRRFRRATVA